MLDRVELADGEVIGLDLAAPVTLRADGGYWLNGEYTPDPDKPWLKGSATVQAPEYDGPRPATVHGRIVFRSVADRIAATMSAAPGSRWNEDSTEISVDQWRENELRVRIPAGAERIVSIVALDASGEAVGPRGPCSGLGERAQGAHRARRRSPCSGAVGAKRSR